MPTRHISDSTYDSTLHNMPAITGNPNVNFELDLYLRVHLIRRDPPGGSLSNHVRDWDGIERECSRWTEGEWRLFCRQYKEQVEQFWNDSFTLVTPAGYDGLDWPLAGRDRRRHNVNCGLRLILVEAGNGAHVSIPVVYLSPSETQFRSHSQLYSNRDLSAETFSSPGGRIDWSFFTLPHEVGHLLGLGHPNDGARICRENAGADICYGANVEQRSEVMGTGPMLSLEDAEPWVNRIAQHTGTRPRQWRATWRSTEAAFRGADQLTLHTN